MQAAKLNLIVLFSYPIDVRSIDVAKCIGAMLVGSVASQPTLNVVCTNGLVM